MSFTETIEEMIGDLEEKRPFLNRQQLELLAYYYDLLAKEWEDIHTGKTVFPDHKKGGTFPLRDMRK